MTNKNGISIQSQKNEKSLWQILSGENLTACLENTKTMHALARLYTELLDESVTARQAVYYFYGQLAAIATLMPGNFSMGWRALAFVTFCQAVRKTRKKN